MDRKRKSLLAAAFGGASLLAADRISRLAARPTSSSLTRALSASRAVSKSSWELFKGLQVPSTRAFVVGAYMHLTFEHQASMLLLLERGLFGSASALLRPCIEAASRGMWLAKCATDSQITEFASGNKFDFPWPFRKLVDAIDIRLNRQVNAKSLFAMFGGKDAWSVINDFCHGGNIHTARRTKTGQLQPSYPELELRSFLILATSAVLLATSAVLETATGTDPARTAQLKAIADLYVREVVPSKTATV